jgi:hypothetical protein
MSSQISILMYGRDAQLLDTRRWVLEQAGYWVSQTTELSSLVRLVPLEHVNLLILCHTLSMEDCGRALALVQTRWPEVQTITLVAGNSGCRLVNSSYSVDSREGPARLINTVAALVKTSPLNA